MNENSGIVKTNFFNRFWGIRMILVGSIMTTWIGCSSIWSTIPVEGMRNGQLFVLVHRPLYAVPLGENSEFIAQIRKSADIRALQFLMAIKPEYSETDSNDCSVRVLATGKVGYSECGADFCLWCFTYDLKSCQVK